MLLSHLVVALATAASTHHRVVQPRPPQPSRAAAATTTLTRAAALRTAALATTATALLPSGAFAIPPPDMLAKAPGATAEMQQAMAPAPAVLYTAPGVKGLSTPDQLALAQHLQKTGAKFYGAYWCSYCFRQRTMFGAGAAKALPYVECAADGFDSQARACRAQADVTGYPTWQIGGKFYGGMRTLQDLQKLSGFDPSVEFPAYVPPPSPPRPAPPPGGFKPPPVATTSGTEELALARHLKSKGAKFYGAYWCGYCGKQRTLFGAEAAAALPYIECDGEGAGSQAAACRSKPEVNGFPTWEIGGKFYGGMRSLDDLAQLSGFVSPAAAAAATIKMPSGGAQAGTLRGDDGCALSTGSEDCD